MLEAGGCVCNDVVSELNLGVLEILEEALCLFVIVVLLALLFLGSHVVLVVFVGALALIILNELVVDVLEALKSGNDVLLVVGLTRALELVVVDAQHLQLVVQLAQVVYAVLERLKLVGADGEHVQLVEVLEAAEVADAVLVERQVFNLCALVEVLDRFNQVE